MFTKLLATAAGAIAGSLIGMLLYVRTFPGYISQADRERAYWLALAYTGTGSAAVSVVLLGATEAFLSRQPGRDRETIRRYLEAQKAQARLPEDIASYQLMLEDLQKEKEGIKDEPRAGN